MFHVCAKRFFLLTAMQTRDRRWTARARCRLKSGKMLHVLRSMPQSRMLQSRSTGRLCSMRLCSKRLHVYVDAALR